MRRIARALALLLLPLLAGCGDPTLWARWRAERAFWHGQRQVERILVQPRAARPADYARAEAAFRAIVDAFPAARWGRAGASRMETEVAAVAGRSALALARLAEMQGRGDEAAAGYARAESVWAALPELALEAAELRAVALQHFGHPEAALAAWEHVARGFGLIDAATGDLSAAQSEAVRQLATGLAGQASAVARDSMLRASEARYVAELGARPHSPAEGALVDAIAEARSLRGDLDGALDAWRRRLAAGGGLDDAGRARRVLALGERSFAAARPDSALVYARWAAREYYGEFRLAALELAARSLRAERQPDSALAVYDRILDEFPRQENAQAEARFQRARVLEDLDRWTLARSEYSALCARFPSHPRTNESWVRVIRHNMEAGEVELARIETEHALAAMDQWVAMQHDETERGRAREGRIAVLLAGGRTRAGIQELQGLWSTVGMSAAGASLGEAAARDAETGLGEATLARGLWQILARSSPDPQMRHRAAAALERLPS